MLNTSLRQIFKQYQPPFAIVCNDAGSANIILYWLKLLKNVEIKLHVKGPAEKIYKAEFPYLNNTSLVETISQSKTLISGTGWSSTVEHDARIMAKKFNLKSIAVIDHWVNYTERFIFNNYEVLPDEIWVTDKYALDIAYKKFKTVRLRNLPNIYQQSQVEKITKIDKEKKSSSSKNVLYALEPVRIKWKGSSKLLPEIQALNFFVNNLNILGIKTNMNIVLRLHPSEDKDKYINWCEHQKNKNIEISSKSEKLHEAIAKSEWVIGCNTYVLVLALMANRKVASSLPLNAPDLALPHPGILRMKNLI